MRVRELVAQLQELDPEAFVYVPINPLWLERLKTVKYPSPYANTVTLVGHRVDADVQECQP